MGTYAASTGVPSDKSVAEIKQTLMRHGAEQFAYMESAREAVVAFIINGWQVRFTLPLPDRHDEEFTHHSRGPRLPEAAERAYEQAIRQRWRALALVIKAKLEAVESGIVSFEQEFAMHTILPGGGSVHDVVIPAMREAYETGGPMVLQIGA